MEPSLIKRKGLLLRKQQGERLIVDYLEDITKLTDLKLTSNELLSLNETDIILSKKKRWLQNGEILFEAEFDLKVDDSFEVFITKLIDTFLEVKHVYLFIENTKYCGTILVPPIPVFLNINKIKEFNSGIITMSSEDSKNSILIDYDNSNGEETIEVEIKGKEWHTLIEKEME